MHKSRSILILRRQIYREKGEKGFKRIVLLLTLAAVVAVMAAPAFAQDERSLPFDPTPPGQREDMPAECVLGFGNGITEARDNLRLSSALPTADDTIYESILRQCG